jgi:hypothetical protein
MRGVQELRNGNSSSILTVLYCQNKKKQNIHDILSFHIHIHEEMCEDEFVVVKTIEKMYHFGYYEWGNCEEIDRQFSIPLGIIIALLIAPRQLRNSYFLVLGHC